ncbi:MAG: aldose 1-epimerase family protein [Verrucomicrobia bacterium]|nr:aldose 1-epimerase family protein [Verrucomicrobiota bacterium]MCF7708055.1 aldose 1-epimerase family protein [Verrucomicrobiota bacterium]
MEKNNSMDYDGKIINSNQVGGIETAVLDNGPGKGCRIAWINTGGGLRYKVSMDRGLDIMDAFHNDKGLAFLTDMGVTPPHSEGNHGFGWLYYFGGGLVKTCGLTHIGGPEVDESGDRGLHDRIGNAVAEVESIVQPDIRAGDLDMRITGVMRQSKLFGPNLQLRRTISGRLGEPIVRLHDVVTNVGPTTTPHMYLYHCNFGWPLVDEGAKILWHGDWTTPGRDMDAEVFHGTRDFRVVPGVMESHCKGAEANAFIDIAADEDGMCSAGVANENLGIAARLRFPKEQFQWLTNWQHWGRGEYVTGLEPGTNPPIGQNAAHEQGSLIMLEPGESRTYELEISVLDDRAEIERFVRTMDLKN